MSSSDPLGCTAGTRKPSEIKADLTVTPYGVEECSGKSSQCSRLRTVEPPIAASLPCTQPVGRYPGACTCSAPWVFRPLWAIFCSEVKAVTASSPAANAVSTAGPGSSSSQRISRGRHEFRGSLEEIDRTVSVVAEVEGHSAPASGEKRGCDPPGVRLDLGWTQARHILDVLCGDRLARGDHVTHLDSGEELCVLVQHHLGSAVRMQQDKGLYYLVTRDVEVTRLDVRDYPKCEHLIDQGVCAQPKFARLTHGKSVGPSDRHGHGICPAACRSPPTVRQTGLDGEDLGSKVTSDVTVPGDAVPVRRLQIRVLTPDFGGDDRGREPGRYVFDMDVDSE